ncbi:MAG: hypothetical protein V1702_04750 [Candidatus Woesearchaeota archaeon]
MSFMQKIYLMVVCIFISIATAQSGLAASIGASPASISFGNVLRNGYAESQLFVSTGASEIVYGHFEVNGEVEGWISFRPNTTNFNVTMNQPRMVTVIVTPPSDVPIGSYSGSLTISGDTLGDISGRAGSVIRTSIILPITVSLTGRQQRGCTAGAFDFEDVEEGSPLVMWSTVRNTGNIRISPLIKLSIWDNLKEKVVMTTELRAKEVLPTVTGRSFVTIEHSLPIGQYWVEASMPECNFETLLTFSVIQKGGISDKGELTELKTPSTALVGETVPITALFYNKGATLVTAQFKGAIKKGGRTIGLVNSDAVEVSAGQVERLLAYFTPNEQGEYTVTGRALYNNKYTYEKSAKFKVIGEKAAYTPLPLLIYLIFVAAAVFFIRKIRQRKRQK